MRVIDLNRINNLLCGECGRLMGYVQENKALYCMNGHCEEQGIEYKLPDSAYVVLEEVDG